MPTYIAHNSKETVSRLIRKEFNNLKGHWNDPIKKELIKAANDYNLNQLATELKNKWKNK